MKLVPSLIRLITFISLITGAVIWAVILSPHINLEHYIFRPFAVLSLVAAIANIGLIALIYKKIQSSDTGIWLLIHLTALVLWSLAEFMQRSSGDLDTAMFWRSIAIFGWAVMPIPYFLFVINYIERPLYIRRLLPQLAMLFMMIGLIYSGLTTQNILISNTYTLESWGYDSPTSWGLGLFTVWFLTIFLAAAALLFREHRKAVSIIRKKQIRLFIISLMIPLIGGTFSDIILPSVFGVDAWPMAAFLTSSAGLLLGFGVYRYGLFSINPISLSGEIMETLAQPVICTDNNFDIQFMNKNAEKMFKQYAPFAGKNIHNLVGDENFKMIKKSIADSTQGTVVNIAKLPLGLEGGVVIAQAQVSKIKQGVEGYIFGLSNITQQVLSMKIIEKEVSIRTELYNQERARLLASVNGLRQGFLIADGGHKVILMNTKAQEMFPDIKISKSQGGSVVDTKAIDLLEKHLKGFNLEEKLKLVVEKSQYIEVEGVDIADSIFDIEILPIGVDDGAIGAVVLFDDVTERTIMQRSKDEFFSIASHELRTPLTAIRGNTSMILNYYEKQLKDPELKEMVTDIHASSLRLIEIVNDFLDTSRLEQGKMIFNIEDISLTKIIEEVVKETSTVAEEQGNKVVFESPGTSLPMVHADMNKLKQVVYNLVGNALKFTEQGLITIKSELQDASIKVTITDTGRGISEESKTLLFRKFQQANSSLITRDTTKGTGLGLYISKLILDNMGGSIRVDNSEVGVGSTFSFTIPISKEVKKN